MGSRVPEHQNRSVAPIAVDQAILGIPLAEGSARLRAKSSALRKWARSGASVREESRAHDGRATPMLFHSVSCGCREHKTTMTRAPTSERADSALALRMPACWEEAGRVATVCATPLCGVLLPAMRQSVRRGAGLRPRGLERPMLTGSDPGIEGALWRTQAPVANQFAARARRRSRESSCSASTWRHSEELRAALL